MKNFLYVFLLCIGCSELDNRSGISAVTNVTGTYNYPVQLTISGTTSEFQIPVPIITVSWYSGQQLLSNSNSYQTVQYSNNITAPSYIQTETNYPIGRYTNYYLWEIITNNVSNYSVAQYNYDLYELDLNSENKNTLLSNVTNTVPNTLVQSFKEKAIYTNKNNTNKIRQFYATNFRRQFARRTRFYYTRSSTGQKFFNFALAFPTNQIVHQNLMLQPTNDLNILYSDPFPSTGVVPTGEGYYYKIFKDGLNFEIINSYKNSNINNQPYQGFVSYTFLRAVDTNKAYYRMTVSNAGNNQNNGSKIVGLIFYGTKIFMAGGSAVFDYGTNRDVEDSWDCTHNASKNNIDFSNRTTFFIGEYF